MKPILFNTEMVRAILDGRKTVTRRKLKKPLNNVYKPPYRVGDILYVRETWRVGAWDENISSIAVDYLADGHSPKKWIQVDSEAFEKYWIQSSDDAIKAGIEPDAEGDYHWERGKGPTRWRPSIHMPKEAARIFLKVTGVRVERLQDITPDQALREGIKPFSDNPTDCVRDFGYLWDSTIKKSDLDRYGWYTNPWVWVIEFERCEKPRENCGRCGYEQCRCCD